MPDERAIASYVERVVDVIAEQTRQVARLAYAVELDFLSRQTSFTAFIAPCEACGCRLITEQLNKCPACLTPTRTDG